MPSGTEESRRVTLADRYELSEGRVFMTGVQALLRVLLEQRRADKQAGRRTSVFVSGYPGSPLGTLDLELVRHQRYAQEHGIVHQPGLNEELAATSVYGSQLLESIGGSLVDGVVGVWYGKAPGVDRAADAIRHGNLIGTMPLGGVMLLAGDDPGCTSSTLPNSSEGVLSTLGVPTLYPGTVQEVLDYGLHAIACSRSSGLWVALKIVTNVADAAATVHVGSDRVSPIMPSAEWGGRRYEHRPDARVLPPYSNELERTLVEVRLPLAAAYAAANGLNEVVHDTDGARVGLIAAGKTYLDLREALLNLGFEGERLAAAGIRILKLGMVFPVEVGAVRRFARGLDRIVVVEEKRPFLESAIRDALYDLRDRPRVMGKKDAEGAPLLPAAGELDAALIADALARVVPGVERARLARRQQVTVGARSLLTLEAARKPFFCSGCPHNRSTLAPPSTLVGGGIGCHSIALLNPDGRGKLTGLTQMGGEGAQWIGIAPFVSAKHFVQNTGDGTFHHSGSLALRAAIAAGVNITYKILYNQAVAMTGGQPVEGMMDVPELVGSLALEGVKRIIVTAEDPGRYAGVKLPAIAQVRSSDRLEEAQSELACVPGVTVLIHDQGCAAEKRRLRKRAQLPDPVTRIHINERVCEGCGDCGRVSSCLSVEPVDTAFGRKTQINQFSCNKDYSCLDGDCPSFVTVVPGKRLVRQRSAPEDIPHPHLPAVHSWNVRLIGIGGTGVVTASRILGVAALLDGKHSQGLDQTGLSQKAGPVVSDVRLTDEPAEAASKLGSGAADLLLIFDILSALSPQNLAVTDPTRTRAVVSTTASPTGEMIRSTDVSFPEINELLEELERHTVRGGNTYVDSAAVTEAVVGDTMPANIATIGAAWQAGLLPLTLASLEEAIRLDGAATEKNLIAFAWGRACVACPDIVATATAREPARRVDVDPRSRELIDRNVWPPALLKLLELRVADLVAYQNADYAKDYIAVVHQVHVIERERLGGHTDLAEGVARYLYKLLAYKDEYEVARLHLDAAEHQRLAERFGSGTRLHWHLHPPLLRTFGIKRKIKVGRWFAPFFHVLRAARRLRGTPLDLFGYTQIRRIERRLPHEYCERILRLLTNLSAANHTTLVEIACAPNLVRGYESIKLASVERYHTHVQELEAAFTSQSSKTHVEPHVV